MLIVWTVFVTLQVNCQAIKSCWEIKPNLKIKRTFHASAVANGKLFLISGATGDKSEFRDITSVEMYDPVKNEWSTKAEIPQAVSLACALTVGNKIFVAGGELDSFKKKSKLLMMYDCFSNKWSLKSSIKIARSFHYSVALNNKIYVIGGRESNKEIKTKQKDSLAVYTIEEYDVIKYTWVVKTVMPFKHFAIGAAVLNNKIFILSDTTNNRMLGDSAVLEEYDPVKNTFIKKAELIPSQCDAAVVGYKNKIYVIGGWRKGTISSVNEYDVIKNKWTRKSDLPYPVQAHQASIIDDKIFISGGLTYTSSGNEKRNNFLVYFPESDKNK